MKCLKFKSIKEARMDKADKVSTPYEELNKVTTLFDSSEEHEFNLQFSNGKTNKTSRPV